MAPGDAWLSPGERERAASLRLPKRRDDFRLGRFTAKRALAAVLGLPDESPSLARIDVRARPDGAPEAWCDGQRFRSLSISHCAGRALAVVGPGDAALGCDLEQVEPRSQGFALDYFRPGERAWLGAAVPDERPLRATLLWSAKESVLKVVGVGLRETTQAVEVEFEEAVGPLGWRPFRARLASPPALPIQGWWRRDAAQVLTVATRPPANEPVLLTRRDLSPPNEL